MRYGRNCRAAVRYTALLSPAVDQTGAPAVALDIVNFDFQIDLS